MKFWVVASSGLVGMEMCNTLLRKKIDFVGSTHAEADVLNKEALERYFKLHRPTHIVNCSAYVDVDGAEGKGGRLCHDINVQGIVHLAELAGKYLARLIHIGTDYVFDGESNLDYVETDPTNPINVYGKTKLEGETRCLEIYPKAVCVRTASLYGPGKEGLITGMIRSLESNEIAKHISDQTSTPTYTHDLAEALFDIRDQSGIFHFVNKGHASRVELLEEVKRLLVRKGVSMKCQRIVGVLQSDAHRLAIRPKRSVLSTKKIEPYLSRPIRTWQEALADYLGVIL
jgi:dTDP-4-dehydrorhamnose reductase